MVQNYIDSHAHLFSAEYTDDLAVVLVRAKEAGVSTIVVPATDIKSSRDALTLAEQYENILCALVYIRTKHRKRMI
jgi:TatD DNase family protein